MFMERGLSFWTLVVGFIVAGMAWTALRPDSSPEHRALIGANPLRMMFDNHRNHAQFLGAVMTLDRYDLLGTTIPWVYRAYLGQWFQPEYFGVELAAWRRAVDDHLDAGAARPIKRLYAWIEEHHAHWLLAAQVPPEPELVGDPRWEADRRRFFEAVLAGDKWAAWDALREHVAATDQLVDAFEEVVRPAMYEVGAMWERGEISPAIEHRASVTSLLALSAVQMNRRPAGERRGLAIVTAAPNEFHRMGGQLVAMALEEDGWQVSNLGANTPAADLVALVAAERPRLLAFSVAMAYNLEGVQAVIEQLRATPACADTRVMVGGLAFRFMPELAHSLGADSAPGSLRQAVLDARRWTNG